MSSERLQELFLDAVELQGDERRLYLSRVQHDEPELAAALERLLARPESDASPIDRPAVASIATHSTSAAPPPAQVGPYRIVRELGQGGMGRVFLAEQETPDFRRTVALKLIDRPRLDAEAVRRFRDEVRILASLEHPGIVRFYDGGRSPEEIWYLALEYVEGVDLVSHSRRSALDVRKRVELLLAVAQAVAYAHSRGIVHRDIKPGNVLVGADGRPRLLDFGISKLLDPSNPSQTTTRSGPRPFTPAYASPEQLAGEAATPASDVYSLGVVLYELLCGERPATIGGEAPAPPSRRLRLQRGRRDDTSPTGGSVSRDLDAICRKALCFDPRERYADGTGLAADLERYLAGARGRGRLSHRTRVAGAVLLVGALAAIWLLLPERAPQPLGALPASSVRGFPFDPINPPPLAELEARFAAAPGDFVAGSAIVVRLAKEGRFDEADLAIARLRQLPGSELEPLVDFAEGSLANRRKERQRALLFFSRARDRALASGRTELLAELRGVVATQLAALGQRDAAIAELELSLADAERDGDFLRLYRSLNDLALERLQRGELEAGERLLERALVAAGRAGVRPLVALGNLAALQGVRGRPDLAAARLRELLELRKLEPSRLREAQTWMKLWEAERDLGRLEDSEASLEQSLALLRPLPGEHDLATALYHRAVVDLESGRFDRLDEILIEIAGVARATQHRRPLGFGREIEGRRDALRGEIEAARAKFATSREILIAQGDNDLAARTGLAWARAEATAGAGDEALRVLDSSLDGVDPATAAELRFLAETLRARIEASAGRLGEARARLDSLRAESAASPSLAWRIAFESARGQLADAEGRTEAARAAFESAIDAARRRGSRVDELELRLALVALGPRSAEAKAAFGEIGAEAGRLGLAVISRRARELSEQSRPPAL